MAIEEYTEVWHRSGGMPIVDAMQEYLLHNGYRRGDRLPNETALAVELGVSRNVVREGVKALEALGIVEVKQGTGTFLLGGTFEGFTRALAFWARSTDLGTETSTGGDLPAGRRQSSWQQITQVRRALELQLITEVLPLHTEATCAQLDELVVEMDAHAKQDEWTVSVDHHFHNLLYLPLNNWVLSGILQAFWSRYREADELRRTHSNPREVVERHRLIVAAVRAQDPGAARDAMIRHFSGY